jgi:hypothetical protein
MALAKLAVLGLVGVGLGCVSPAARRTDEVIEAGANVPLLPDGSPGPEPCPEKARFAMELLELKVGDATRVEIDANQVEREPLTINAGPIESIMTRSMGTLGPLTRLYGRVWTSGPRAVIRYYWAQRPEGKRIPICAVARLGAGQLEGKPGKFPGSTELPGSAALAFVVESFL